MSELIVSKYHVVAETRELGRAFFPILLRWAQKSAPTDELILSFERVQFVSPSFIDETIARLIREHPRLSERLRIASVSPFTRKMLRSTLRARGIAREIPVYEPA